MIPLAVQIVVTLAARFFVPWRRAIRLGLVALFVFTGVSHFSSLKHDMAAMIPPPLTGQLWLIYFTGLCELAGALGLLVPRLRRTAAWALAVMLVGLFPANVYAAMAGVTLRGAAATNLWIRTPMQFLWIALLVWDARREGDE